VDFKKIALVILALLMLPAELFFVMNFVGGVLADVLLLFCRHNCVAP
jgi:hypothetical protein